MCCDLQHRQFNGNPQIGTSSFFELSLDDLSILSRISPRRTPVNPVITIKIIAEILYCQKKKLIVTI